MIEDKFSFLLKLKGVILIKCSIELEDDLEEPNYFS